MTATAVRPAPSKPDAKPSGASRRFGYLVAIAVNIGLLYAANNLLTWNWASFVTDDFTRVLPLLRVSLGFAIVANVVYLFYDPAWFRSIGQVLVLGISLAVTARFYQVFPLDFASMQYDWAWVARTVLIVSFIGTGVGIIVELAKLVRRPSAA